MLKKVEQHFRIESIGFPLDRVFERDHDFEGEYHDFIELVYVHSGNVEVVENEKVYMLQKGDLILHAPMEFHRIKSSARTSPHVLNLSITVSPALPGQLFDGVFHLSPEQRTDFMRCFESADSFITCAESPPYQGQQSADALAALLLEICRAAPGRNVLSKEDSALLYKRLVSDMQKAVCQNLSLDELAKRNYISVSYIKKLFRMYANTSPKHFYDVLRAKEAMLLLQKGAPATTVAEKMHFSSPNYFTLFFKKQVGITPSEYKKKLSV